ncbi:MAG: cytotoxic translational repressor of toxin-antitoxin stability system [Thermomicrobiales bacterium]|jgi:mRNA-degrading endonuclease RelE of RelBE toxin-antitoxin system|nr:cytotoxic translational repressor of toxin-antitoxin stability system [Thermomicrobiales bacterium]
MKTEHPSFAVEPTREAEKDLACLRPWTAQATQAILRLEQQPYLGHSLTGSLKGARALEFSLRGGGAYRAVYVVLEEHHTCLVFIVGPHENTYDKAERRLAALRRAGRI